MKTADVPSSSSNDNQEGGGMQVICAGLGRTGTLSLHEALQILGYKTYHFVDFHHLNEWVDVATAARGENESDAAVEKLLDLMEQDGVTATLDNPTCDIYQDLVRRYPKAKVIVTVRDTPQEFVQSWKILLDTMIITEQPFSWRFPCFFGYIPLFYKLKQIRHFMGTTHLGLPPGELTHGWRNHSDEWLAEQYERHIQHVMDTVPKDQLLIFNVKEGWGPLCEFLGSSSGQVGIPNESFPHSQVNTTRSLKRLRRQLLAVVYGWIPTLLIVGVAGATTLYLRGRAGQPSPRTTTRTFGGRPN